MRSGRLASSPIGWSLPPAGAASIELHPPPLSMPQAPISKPGVRAHEVRGGLFSGWRRPAIKAVLIGVAMGLTPIYPGAPLARTGTTPAVSVPATEEAMAADAFAELQRAPGFAALAPEVRARLSAYVGGTNSEVSIPAAMSLRVVIKSQAFLAMNADQQRAALESFLRDQPMLTPVASLVAERWATRAAYAISDPAPLDKVSFRSGDAAGLRYQVTIGAQTIPVHMPAPGVTVSGYLPTIEQIAQALAGLPDRNRALVTSVYANPGANPSDSYYATQFGRRGFTSYMSADSNGLVSVYPGLGPTRPSSIDFSFLHETGHTLSNRLFGDHYTDRRWDRWKAAIASDNLRPTSYARESPGEDFAETMVFYLSSRRNPVAHAELRAMFPARFAILDSLGL